MSHRSSARRYLSTGIILAAVGTLLLFSGDVLTVVGVTLEQAGLISFVVALTKIWTAFAMPLAAGLICLALYLRTVDDR
ncbi:hypothetical protein [Leifsonia sp. Le1]|uniref:hypothetical protein n=1 Tax=Leifsonia sp. Le1 TaxID=3404918 RepID=UPI003EC137A6